MSQVGELSFSMYQIIQKKRDGLSLTPEEIKWVISGLTKSSDIADYQMSALLMAIYLKGMDPEETAALTDAMLYSGAVINYDDPTVIDKHSTGGVGDKTSFIIAPLAAACGVKVPMMAGRGLGHTGGTVDKIEAIPGFQTSLDLETFRQKVLDEGLALIGQTKDIAPADKKIYALRDVTATIESIPLITASIMSKKLAEGARGIVMDIKTGNGAFMAQKQQAKELAKSLSDTGLRFKRHMMTVISDMSQPLGFAVGNSCEIIECIETLKGQGPKDLEELSLVLTGGMIYAAGLASNHDKGIQMAKRALDSGEGLEVFRKLIKGQGGNESIIDDYSILPQAECTSEIYAPKSGFISEMDCKGIGLHCVSLGGGRKKTADKIDHSVGLIFNKKVGDQIQEGDLLLKVEHHSDQTQLIEQMKKQLLDKQITISEKRPTKSLELIQDIDMKFSTKG